MQLSRIGPIALEGPLGDAADGNVLRGVHVERNLKLAVKLLPKSLINQTMGDDTFMADAKALTKLVHPNIVRVLGGAMENGQPYLAMELVEGESLRTRLDRLGRLPWETVVDIAEAICAALEYAHAAGRPHLRLTPSRVLLAKDGGVKIVGFDHAWVDRDAILALRVPVDEAQFYPQEVFRGKKSSTLPTCDLFSLGAILYESLTGEMPWPTRSVHELVQIRRDRPAPRVSSKVLDSPVWLDALVAKLLEVRRADRLPSAEETRRAIFSARQKVAQGVGAAKQAFSGKQGTLALGGDKKELRRLRKHSAPREKVEAVAFYERVWFLALCLALLAGGAVWSLWPASEEKLYARAAPLMASKSAVDWQAAEPVVAELVERFPKTSHREEIEEFQLRVAVHDAEEDVKNIDRFGRKPKSELERLYADAWDEERKGDPLEAWEKYDAIQKMYAERDKLPLEQRALLELTAQRIEQLRQAAQEDREVAALVRDRLADAQDAIREGNRLKARSLLDSIVSLYDGNSEVQPLVDQAQEMIRALNSRE